MNTRTAESATPSISPRKTESISGTMLRSLRRYGGNPDLMRKEHPELDLRRPIPDPGKLPRK